MLTNFQLKTGTTISSDTRRGRTAMARIMTAHVAAAVSRMAASGLGAAALVWKARKKFDPLTSFVITVARKLKLA